MGRVVLVTGGTGGIGSEVVHQLASKGFTTIFTGRCVAQLDEVEANFKRQRLKTYPVHLDLTSNASIHSFHQAILKNHGRIDVLINNAGVYLDGPNEHGIYANFLTLEPEVLKKTLAVNLYGPLKLIQQFLPLMKRNQFGRIVNVSSGMGRFAEMDHRAAFYRISKTALNALTVITADLCKEDNILVNAVCPGWVRTKMGGTKAVRTPKEGAQGVVWAATLPDNGPRGKFFRDGKELDWSRLSPEIDTWAFEGPFY